MYKINIFLNNQLISSTETDQEEVIIGRESSSTIIVKNNNLSRNHAKIFFKKGLIFILDLESKNGVLINGEKIPAKKETRVLSRDKIHLGKKIQLKIEKKENNDGVTKTLKNIFEKSKAGIKVINPFNKKNKNANENKYRKNEDEKILSFTKSNEIKKENKKLKLEKDIPVDQWNQYQPDKYDSGVDLWSKSLTKSQTKSLLEKKNNYADLSKEEFNKLLLKEKQLNQKSSKNEFIHILSKVLIFALVFFTIYYIYTLTFST